MIKQMPVLWLVVASCFLCSAVEVSSEIESSISSDSTSQAMVGSLRFYGITKTMRTTTTVVHLYTTYVRQTCLSVQPGTSACSETTPPTTTSTTTTTTTTTTTPTPVTVTPATTTSGTTATTASTTTASPFQIVKDQFIPSVSANITINKLTASSLNLPQLSAIGSGLGGLFNKRPANVQVSASASATVTTNGRRRRSRIMVEKIQPSAIRPVEVTANPDMSLRESIQQDVAVEASRAEEYQEYYITGLMPHFAERALGINPITIVRLDPTTIIVTQTVTSKFPFDKPSDRVTLSYGGCVPSNVVAMNLRNCL
ncbi:mucin-2-like [Daphnia carinata]|uniref:mucin-2-like n=1 Tax=Daphnia carinata TaxID=120202 RepID=UPI00257F4C1F|nr:mucin-2-like [Daphnia carinata]